MAAVKNVNIENFIGVYDNYITKEECDKAISLFEDQHKFKNTIDRMQLENRSITTIQDRQFFGGGYNMDIWWEDLKSFYSTLESYAQFKSFAITHNKTKQRLNDRKCRYKRTTLRLSCYKWCSRGLPPFTFRAE